jgi:hypothetical protein
VGEARPAEDEAPAKTAARLTTGAAARGKHFADAVTLLEIAPPEEGGVSERRLPGDRKLSPPSPLPARRVGWAHPVLRWLAYVAVVIMLTALFLVILIDIFHLG